MKDKTPTQTVETRATPTRLNGLFWTVTYAIISAIVLHDIIKFIEGRFWSRSWVGDVKASWENTSRETRPSGGLCSGPSGNFNSVEFDWDKVTPSPTLQWVTCYDEKQCARLEVPLDYNNAKDVGLYGEKASIALLRIPAKVGSSDPRYKGPILFNPGGPGGPGVQAILVRGIHFQAILGDEYDIVGFDPRGIGYTRPVIDVFDTALDRAAWNIRNADAPMVNETRTAMVEIAAKSKLINDLALEKMEEAARHVNTVVVAKDMLTIINAYGYDKLQYWGFSYGSVLGATFAALFPENVGRLVIDGVLDSEKYYEGTYIESIRNVDKGFDMAFKQCSESGSECALYEATAEKVKDRYLRILSRLDEKPVTVRVKNTDTIGIIRRRQIHQAFFACIYQPYAQMKTFFGALRALENDDGQPAWEFLERLQQGQPSKLSCDCADKAPLPTGGEESGAAVMCTDGGAMSDDPEIMRKHVNQLANISFFGDVWSAIRMRCIGWKIQPAWQWTGPVRGNTSFPLLVVGNTLDPVTPDAEIVSKRFSNSALLIQNSAGHCSLSAVSTCTAMAIRTYFREGILPKKGTMCEIEDHMFLNHTTPVSDRPTAVDEAGRGRQGGPELEQESHVENIKVRGALRALKALRNQDQVGGPFKLT